MRRLRITDIEIVRANDALRETGLIAWVNLLIDGIWRVNGITIRRCRDGSYRISFPGRRSSGKADYAYFEPVLSWPREEIEEAIREQLLREEGAL